MTAWRTACLIAAALAIPAMLVAKAPRPMAQPAAAILEAPVLGWLELAPTTQGEGPDMMLGIGGRVFSPAAIRGLYTLEVNRRGKGGVSKSSQGGAFATEPGKVIALSRTMINIQRDDQIEITLRLFSGETEIFRATVQSSFPSAT